MGVEVSSLFFIVVCSSTWTKKTWTVEEETDIHTAWIWVCLGFCRLFAFFIVLKGCVKVRCKRYYQVNFNKRSADWRTSWG